MSSYKEKLNQITTFIFDVDGVLTNGEVLLYNGEVIRSLNSKDGYAFQYAKKKKFHTFIITGGNSEDVKKSLMNLGITEVCLLSNDKITVYKSLQAKYGFKDEEVMYMGDDIPDIPLLKLVGLSVCPQDACSDVKEICDYQSPINGGTGCARDIIEQTLRVQGKWLNDDAYLW